MNPVLTRQIQSDSVALEMARVQRQRLGGDVWLLVVGHLSLMALVAGLVWAPAVRTRLVWWIVAVLGTTLARAVWQWRARDPTLSDAQVVKWTRVLVILQGVAWGVGLALLVNAISEEERAIVLIGYAGLLASATNTLVGDRVSLVGFLTAAYSPVLLSLLTNTIERDDAVVIAMIVLFSGVVLSLHNRARNALADYLRTAHALRDSEDRFQSFFDESPIGKSITALDGTLLRVNHALCAMMGYTATEIQSLSFEDITHPDDVAPSRRAREELLSGTTDHTHVDKRYRTKTGEWVWAHVTIGLHRDAAGAPEHFLTHVQDITERKRAEQALSDSERYFRALIEEGSDLTTLVDENAYIRYASPANERVLGYAPAELLGQRAFDFIHPDDLADALAVFADGSSAAGSVKRLEFRFRHKDGSWRVLSAAGRNMFDDPVIRAGVINARDVTDQKLAEQQVKTLEGILPICASCKRIHTESGAWQAVESYVRDHTEAEFSHGICPDCAARDWGARAS